MKIRSFLCGAWAVALLGSVLPAARADVPADLTAFTDAAQITYQEPAAAMVRLGIMTGGEDFRPQDPVSRALAAKYMVLIRRGGEDLILSAEANPHSDFSDMEGHWAQAYVSYCEEAGILNGRGNTLFDPDAPVTGMEFAKMALAALGYDPVAYGLTGPDWASMTNRVALQVCKPSLYDGLGEDVALSDPLTREAATQILYNTLSNPVIERVPDTTSYPGEVTYRYGVKKDREGLEVSFFSIYFDATKWESLAAGS